MASWGAHFSCVVVHAEASVLEVLVRLQDFLRLRKEQPGLAEAQDDCSPLVGLQLRGQVCVLCNLGLAEQTLKLRTPGVFAHDVLGSVGDRDPRLCVGVRIAGGACDKEICPKDRAGGRRETHEGGGEKHTNSCHRFLPPQNLHPPRSPPERELRSRFQCLLLGPISFRTTGFIPAFARVFFAAVIALLASSSIFLQLR
jgi:hypothetical protein